MRALVLTGLLLAGGTQAQDDPHQWLEAVQDDKALAFADAHSQRTEAALRAMPGFEQLREQLHEVLASPARLAPVSVHGGLAYNFWRDAEHPRGIWRRSPLAAYLAGKPDWQTVLDLDQLARDEGEPWNWAWASCQQGAPRCMLALSRGGGDAKVQREFDVQAKRFVPGGFALPEAKSSVAWVDANTLAVATDFGEGSMTRSGYPRLLKLWKRGSPLAQAKTIYEAGADDMGLWVWDENGRQLVVERRGGFFDGQQWLLRQGKLQKLRKPDHATALPQGERLLLELRKDWTLAGRTYAAGSLLVMGTQALIEGKPKIQALFTPGERSALHSYAATRSAVVGVVQDEGGHRLVEWKPGAKGLWTQRELPSQGAATLSVRAVDSRSSDGYWLTRTGFLLPSELRHALSGSDEPPQLVQQLPQLFDASGLEVQRLATTAADGTRIPYWLVQPKGPVPAGGRPTLLYGYGGFEISLNPSYSGILGRAWLAKGGAYVVANIRGGGEFGPRWHQSAQKEHRQRSFSDFIAVAEDLQRRGLTTPKQLGILGGSLGGLLTSVAMVQRPELFGAVVSQVPLTDMRRYHRLLAGHSWIAEYGDPDIPAEWDYIKAYSPYQQAKKTEPPYPPVLYTSSTLDDRVHPGHARKMVARLQQLGQPVWYWENREGGHAGASDLGRTALMWALSYGFLQQQLMMAPAQEAASASAR